MTPEAEEIYNRIKLRPRRLITAATVQADAKPATKNTTKTPPKSEA